MNSGFRIAGGAAMAAMLIAGAGVAAEGTTGNLAAGAYPAPDCGERPRAPERPESFDSERQVAAFNAAVQAFNAANRDYYECIQRYADGAAEDIRAIRARVRAVIEQANARGG